MKSFRIDYINKCALIRLSCYFERRNALHLNVYDSCEEPKIFYFSFRKKICIIHVSVFDIILRGCFVKIYSYIFIWLYIIWISIECNFLTWEGWEGVLFRYNSPCINYYTFFLLLRKNWIFFKKIFQFVIA